MRNLCQAIISVACFLEMSGDDVVDPDSAVKALEDIGYSLQHATDQEKGAFVAACEEEATRLQDHATYAKSAEFVRGLPAALGR